MSKKPQNCTEMIINEIIWRETNSKNKLSELFVTNELEFMHFILSLVDCHIAISMGGPRTLCSERDRLLVELVEVLVVYACILEFLYFGLLDVFDLVSLRVDFFSNLPALLQEV